MLFRPHERAELKDQLTIIKVGIALFVAVTLICAALLAVPLWEALVESWGRSSTSRSWPIAAGLNRPATG
jgi:hypothetical protein